MQKEKLLLTVDIGTTAVKVCVFDTRLRLLQSSSQEYQLITRGGWVELEPQTYWQAVTACARRVAGSLPKNAEVAAVGVTTQGETLIPVDESGRPLRNAIVWLDGRAEEEAREISRLADPEVFYQTTGIPECNGYCPISKLLWLRRNEPKVYEKTRYFLLLEDYILFCLTGRFVTEKALLCTTGYFNLQTDEIWTELMEKAGLDAAKLPPAMECGERVGKLLPEAAAELGISPDAVAFTTAMDQVASALGAGNVQDGFVTETTGTALCAAMTVPGGRNAPIADSVTSRRIPVYRHFCRDSRLLLTVSMTAGIALKWFKDSFCREETEKAREQGVSVYRILDGLAAASEPLCGGVQMLPFLSPGAGEPKGAFYGLTLDAGKKEFVRAVLEGVCYMLREDLENMEAASGVKTQQITSLGGGAGSPLWCGIKAAVLEREVLAPAMQESTSLGAAVLCAVGLGWYGSVQEAIALPGGEQEEERYLPQAGLCEQYRKGYSGYRRLKQALAGLEE